MKPILLGMAFVLLPAAHGAHSCSPPSSYDVFPEHWRFAATQFYEKFEQLHAEEVPSHISIHGTSKQLSLFGLPILLHLRAGCDVRWVRSVIKEKTTALKNYLLTSDLANLPDEEKATALQRYRARIAVAKALSSAENFQIHGLFYQKKDEAFQGRRLDSARKAEEREAKQERTEALKLNRRELLATLKAHHTKFIEEQKAEWAAVRPQKK